MPDMKILPLLLCIYCLIEENSVAAESKECSSRGESEAGGYFKLEEGSGHFDCIKRIKVNKGFRVRMFPMSSKTNFEVEVLECSDSTKSPVPAFVRNLEVYVSKENEIEVKIAAKSAPLDIQWWRVCGGTLDGNSGKMIGPEHASGYPENQTCIWNITVQNGYMMSFTLNVDDYNGKNNCSLDYIQVEEWQSEETISKDFICSGILTLKSNKSLRIIFQSDNDPTTGLSFNASWLSKCGENFYADNGELASPDNPADFNSEVQCNWTISVSPGHTVVINYNFPKTSNEEAGCNSYVQVTEADSNASKILCKSSKFAVHKSSFNTLHIFFMYQPGMNYTRFYAKWHSEAQRHEDKDAILHAVAVSVALVIFIILVLLVRRAKSLRWFAKQQSTNKIKENMYDSLNEVDLEVENSNLLCRRPPTPPVARLCEIQAEVRKRMQLGNETHDTCHGEPTERWTNSFIRDRTADHDVKPEDVPSEQEKLSMRNESTMESFRNASCISAVNASLMERRSVYSTKSVEKNCLVDENTANIMDNDGYLIPVDFNSSAERSPSIANSDSIKLKVDIHREDDKQVNTRLVENQGNEAYTAMGEFIAAPLGCSRLDNGAQSKQLQSDKDETHGKQDVVNEIRTDQSKQSYLTHPAYSKSK